MRRKTNFCQLAAGSKDRVALFSVLGGNRGERSGNGNDGKVAIVTGAGGRGNSIGRAYAMGLANAGAAVVVADLNAEGAARVADEINVSGGKALALQVDITDRASVAAMAEAAAKAEANKPKE